MVIDRHSNYSQITQQEVLNYRIAKHNTKSPTWEIYWYIAFQKALARDVDHNLAAMGSGRERWVLLNMVSDIGVGKELCDTGNDHFGNL